MPSKNEANPWLTLPALKDQLLGEATFSHPSRGGRAFSQRCLVMAQSTSSSRGLHPLGPVRDLRSRLKHWARFSTSLSTAGRISDALIVQRLEPILNERSGGIEC